MRGQLDALRRGGGCRLSNWMANVPASSGAFSMIVTQMAAPFRSSTWQKSERYGGASRGPAVGLAVAGHSIRCPGPFPYLFVPIPHHLCTLSVASDPTKKKNP